MTPEFPASPAPANADTAAGASVDVASNGSSATPAPRDRPAAPDPQGQEDTRRTIQSKGWKTLDDAAKGYRELFAKFSDVSAKALSPPAPDASAEAWDAFYAKLGRPDRPDGYELKLAADLPKNLPYDAAKASQYKQWSYQAGLTSRQAQTLHDLAATAAVEDFRNAEAAFVAKAEQATVALERAWGPSSSNRFAQNVEATDRFIRMNGGDALTRELKESGVLSRDGHVLSPLLAQAMARAGQAFAEDQFVAGERAAAPRDPASTLYPSDPFRR